MLVSAFAEPTTACTANWCVLAAVSPETTVWVDAVRVASRPSTVTRYSTGVVEPGTTDGCQRNDASVAVTLVACSPVATVGFWLAAFGRRV